MGQLGVGNQFTASQTGNFNAVDWVQQSSTNNYYDAAYNIANLTQSGTGNQIYGGQTGAGAGYNTVTVGQSGNNNVVNATQNGAGGNTLTINQH